MNLRNYLKKIFFYQLKVILFLTLFISCKSSENSPVEPQIYSRGELTDATWLGKFNKSFLQTSAEQYQTNVQINYDVNVYKVIYKTSDPQGNIVTASGVIFSPDGQNNLPLMSLQHGTQSNRSSVGSVNVEESPEGFISAGIGYFTLVPDYLGLGESQILHPYHYAKTSAETVIDFIRACRTEAGSLNIKLNGQVFLAGYSEGGYVTMAAHREIQQNYSDEIKVTASAPMAGAYDLYLTAQILLQNKTYGEPSFIAFLFDAYNRIYGWDILSSIFNSPYAEKIPSLFDGSKSINQIDSELTTDLTILFKKDFVDSFEAGTETTVSNALKENSLINWVPVAPLRLFHGDADQYVPYQNSVEARDYFISHGATDVGLITIQGGDHNTSAIPSILGAVQWFDTFRLQNTSRQNEVIAMKGNR